MAGRKIALIDGYSLLFRAYYGTRFLSTSDGRPTNALYGFLQMLFQLLKEHQPDEVVVALDAPGKTFRHADFPDYKATRSKTPDDLVEQLMASRDLLAALGVPTVEVVGFEADDVIGTLSKRSSEKGWETLIVTADMDAVQLVDEHVHLMRTDRGTTNLFRMDPAAVKEKYGFEPLQMIDYKALCGDSSDNIPGVRGIGDKSAKALLRDFDGIEGILERLDEVPEKFRKKIEAEIEAMRLSHKTAIIERDAPIEYEFADYHLSADKLAEASQMLENYEFRTLNERLPAILARYIEGGEAHMPVTVQREAVEVERGEPLGDGEIAKWVGDQLYSMVLVSDAGEDQLFAADDQSAWICAGGVARPAPAEAGLRFMADNTERALLHNGKELLRRTGSMGASAFDSYLAGFVLNAGRSSYELSDLAVGYLGVGRPEDGAQMAATLHMLEPVMTEQLKSEEQLGVYEHIELPLAPIVAEMERIGIAADRKYLESFSDRLTGMIHAKRDEVYELAGQEFNIGSPKQLGELLFGKLGLPGGRKTKTGYSTSADILNELAVTTPVARAVLEWRELSKLQSTYASVLPKLIEADGRIHTTLNQAGAATGRFSSNNPNLQNIPARTELGREIRKAFVAQEGWTLGSFDYSQVELRILAHMCDDEALSTAFQEGRDVHTATASLMFGVEQAEVDKSQRGLAKLLNFAVLYGASGAGLAQQLEGKFSVEEARALIRQYYERFPKIRAFTCSLVDQARELGYTQTMSGRRRYFPDLIAGNRMMRAAAERQAMNAPIQGTAADMIKIAMPRVRELIQASGARMLLQVHDELLFEIPDMEAFPADDVARAMADAIKLDVPVVVESKFGQNWLEMN